MKARHEGVRFMRLIKRVIITNTLASIVLLFTFALLAVERFHSEEIKETNANLERCIRTFGAFLSHMPSMIQVSQLTDHFDSIQDTLTTNKPL